MSTIAALALATAAIGLPKEAIAAQVARHLDETSLVVQDGSERIIVRLEHVGSAPKCHREKASAWARRVLPAGSAVYVLRTEARLPSETVGRVYFRHEGAVYDFGKLAIRAGHADLISWSAPVEYVESRFNARIEFDGAWGGCAILDTFRPTAEREGLEPSILAGIAMTESRYGKRPWPWTLNVAGKGYYFPSRQHAFDFAQKVLASGRRNFDVGVMQVNWHYHGHRFPSLWEAFDFRANIDVGAKILSEENRRAGNLAVAVARYHSADPGRGSSYLRRFFQYYTAMRRQAG